MRLESERFKMVVLRLFHTELEAVFEEYNINQDKDFRKVSKAMNAALFPAHPYGTQTTIGEGEHLKNPSHLRIKEYFAKYYVPNNMAIVLAGDFDPDEAVATAEKYFGGYQAQPVAPFAYETQPEIKETTKLEVLGQEAEYVKMSWRFDGARSTDPLMLSMISRLLYNGQAGLIDLNLLKKQQVLSASAGVLAMEDFSTFSLQGKPREGQSLEDVEQILLTELNKIKAGDFNEWLIDAVIKDYKLSEITSNESNNARAHFMTTAFILGLNWEDKVTFADRMAKITKAEVMAFAQAHLNDNYVVAYKRTGDDDTVMKVDKPALTPVTLNRADPSDFTTNFLSTAAERLAPVFVDFEQSIQREHLASGVPVDYIRNENNPTFSMDYILEMGKLADARLPIAVTYLKYLGTDKHTVDELNQEFFKLGLSFDVFSNNERVYVSLNGLEESFEAGVQLFEYILANPKPDKAALANVVADMLLKRTNLTKDKRTILRSGMVNYARFGKENSFTAILPEAELRALEPTALTEMISSLTSYEHSIFYYGSQPKEAVVRVLNKYHQVPATLKPLKPNKVYKDQTKAENTVYFLDFPMVQAEFLMLTKTANQFDLDQYIMAELYNNYFGFGLSSIVFQEIRESRALAYSAYAYYASPAKLKEPHLFQAYVGTQPDKLQDAIPALCDIIENMPLSEEQIEQSRQSILKKIETDRITKSSIFWSKRTNEQRGIQHDVRKDIYEKMQTVSAASLSEFQEKYVKGSTYNFLLLGSKEQIDMEYVQTLGNVVELSLSDVFGFEVEA